MEALAIALKVLDVVTAGAATYDRAMEVKAKLQEMQAEGRDPTDDEWEALFNEYENLSDRLDNAAKD